MKKIQDTIDEAARLMAEIGFDQREKNLNAEKQRISLEKHKAAIIGQVKTGKSTLINKVILSLVILSTAQSGWPQGTAFTYQGNLLNGGQAANGNFDIKFTVLPDSQYGYPVGPVLTNYAVPVNGGLFSAVLDFGDIFSGSNYWLEIGVRTSGNGSFTTLQPRQPFTPIPYATYSSKASNALYATFANSAATAGSVPANGIIGTIGANNLPSNVAVLSPDGTLPISDLPTNIALGNGTTWQSPITPSVQAQPNTAYVLTNAQQTTITLPTTPQIGDTLNIIGAGTGGWLIAQNSNQTVTATFYPLTLQRDLVQSWSGIAMSGDGTRVFASVYGGGIWVSSNSGATWSLTSAPITNWGSVQTSWDGKIVAAAAASTGVSISGNSGTNWAWPVGPDGGGPLTLSADGTTILTRDSHYNVWLSTNSATWAKVGQLQILGGANPWSAFAISSNGTELVACTVIPGQIFISRDSGSHWLTTTAPTTNWTDIVCTSDGRKIIATAGGAGGEVNGFWISTDFGTNWTQFQTTVPVPSGRFVGPMVSSTDGSSLADVVTFLTYAGHEFSAIWTSANSGINWTPLGNATQDSDSPPWEAVALSGDGTKIAADQYGGGIYIFGNGLISSQTASLSGSTTLGGSGFLEGYYGATVELVYAGNGRFVAVTQQGTLYGH